MGEVWRARDQKLGRELAIKTLSEEFAKDEERLARFEREAKLLASLTRSKRADDKATSSGVVPGCLRQSGAGHPEEKTRNDQICQFHQWPLSEDAIGSGAGCQ